MLEWFAFVGGTIATLLPIANPFSTAPVFASMTKRYGDTERNRQARQAAIYMTIVLLVTLFIGALILTFFGIGIPAMRIAAGLLIAKIGFSMVSPVQEEQVSEEGKGEAMLKHDIAFTPIALPLLSGPGSMAATLSMASVATSVSHYMGVAAGIVIVAGISWLMLRFSSAVADYLGETGMNALTRVMGFLLVCIGIQFVATGVFEGLSSPEVIGPVVEAIQKAAGD